MYDIRNLDHLITFYGGRRQAEQRFSVTRTCIENWKSRGIPTGWQAEIIFDLVEAGRTFDPDLFDASHHKGAQLINLLIGGKQADAA